MATFKYGGLVEQVNSVTAAAGTTTLVNTSKQVQVLLASGVNGQTYVLPDATTMSVGQKFEFYNVSNAVLTVNYNGGTSFGTVNPNSSLVIKLQANGTNLGVWVTLASGSGSGTGVKNYLSAMTASLGAPTPNTGNGNFENGTTTGWSLAHSTLDANTKIPNQASGSWTAASGNLTDAIVSSGQLAGSYSVNYASSAADVAGDMLVSSAFFIDKEDQAQTVGYSFAMKVNSGAANANFSGTSLNSFSVAIYDVTNGVWLTNVTNRFGVIQQAGTTYVTGSFQTSSNGTQYRLAFYNMNATSGATSIYLDDFVVGPVVGVAAAAFTAPTIQKFLSGSGTYTLPTNPLPAYIKVRISGGGGGASGSGTGGTGGSGGNGGTTTFGTSLLTATGGTGGNDQADGGPGGTATVSSPATQIVAVTGGHGGTSNGPAAAGAIVMGAPGGSNPLGGAGMGSSDSAGGGYAAAANTGGGGGGAESPVTGTGGAGGGGGGYLEALIVTPASSYAYSVGAAGTAGTAGTSGFGGGAGGSGVVIVEEYYSTGATGTVGTGNGSFQSVLPTIQKFTSGSGTYITPTNPIPLYIEVELVGGGGGSSGSGTSSTGGAGGTGGNSSFGSSLLTANGGGGGGTSGGSGTGGNATINTPAVGDSVSGANGGYACYTASTATYLVGGYGGNTPFGGGGGAGNQSNGLSGTANTGGGGGGDGTNAVNSIWGGGGGGGGAYLKAIITNPSSSYAYSVGSAGSAGAAGTNGTVGHTGGSGMIVVREYYSVGGAAANNAAPTSGAFKTAPTRQIFTSGSGTYTTPSNPIPLYIKVRMVGGGGGGAGGGTSQPAGGTGGSSTFGSSFLTCNGGVGAPSSTGGTGGGTSINSPAYGTSVTGGNGGGGSFQNSNASNAVVLVGGGGGDSPLFSGGGRTSGIQATGQAGNANTGGGGQGGSSSQQINDTAGGGGGSGGFIEAIVPSPASSYTYSVGTAGTAGAAGTGVGFAAGAGGSGYIEVTEYYQ